MLRSLRYYRGLSVSVALGAAVATSVLTGALIVGDSVRGSLRQITLERLGAIDQALVSERFFRASVAADLATVSGAQVVPATLLAGTAVHVQSRARASRVQIVGADPALARMLGGELDFTGPAASSARVVFPPAIINRSLQQQLGARVGDDLIVAFQRQTAVPRESLFGRRASADVVQRLRLRLRRVVEDDGLGRFGLQPHQAQPLNIFVPLDDLETALDRQGKVNALLLAEDGSSDGCGQLAAALDAALTLEDYGLFVRVGSDAAVLESRRFLIDAASSAAAGRAALEVQAPHASVFTYMATAIASDDGSVPYSTVTALDPGVLDQAARTLGRLELRDGSRAPTLNDNEILVNEWVAEDLAVAAGDSVTLSYYIVDPDEQLQTRHTRLRVSGVVAMTGSGADRGLTPDYPGIQGARNIGDWSTPFPVDLNRIRARDEAYWEQHGATPKAFVGIEAGARMWSNRFGEMTSFRIAAAPDNDLATTTALFERALLQQLRPQQAGFVFQPVREQGLRAAEGATDFSMLFIGFSLFIITAALLLVVLLFRLNVEQRLRELGLLMAVGFTVALVRRRFLLEGIALALVGGIIGMAGSLGYGWAMLAGLRHLWQDAVGTPDLQLHVEASSLVGGLVFSVVIVAASILVAVRRYSRLPVRSLLAGSASSLSIQSTGRRRSPVAVLFALCAGAGALLANGADSSHAAGLFFFSGAALLGCGLSVCSSWMKGRVRVNASSISTLGGIGVRMGVRNIGRHPGRSMLAVSLIACACFVIVAVGASGRDFDDVGKDVATTGGFALLAETEIPLFQSLTTSSGRDELALSLGVKSVLSQSRVFAFRNRSGEDASCLNLYRPERPRVLGVPDEFIQRGGFHFKQVESFPQAVVAKENPWSLLNLDLGPGTIPVFGDYNSARWILHLDVGDRLTLDVNPDGAQVELLLVGLLDRSVFQSELLMSMENFERYFPAESGFGFYAFDVPAELDAAGLAVDLERDLEAYGFDVMAASERAARFQAVENTYLSTFQTLGGLGLLLGTLGLAIVSIRNALERTGELAVQRAFGFTRTRLYRMLLTESGVLLLTGVVLGTGCALAAVLPHLGGTAMPWKSLAVTLGLVVAAGMASAAIAALLAMQAKLLPALKSG